MLEYSKIVLKTYIGEHEINRRTFYVRELRLGLRLGLRLDLRYFLVYFLRNLGLYLRAVSKRN
jgi:hypothetical protein